MRISVGGLVGLVLCVVGCGEDGPPTRVTLTRVEVPGGCEPPADAQQLEVFALGDFGERGLSGAGDVALSIDSFPGDTRAFALRVLGAGGAVRAVGRTGTLDLAAMNDGDEIPIFLAPPRGFCPVGSLANPRIRPIVARAGDGALVVGGVRDPMEPPWPAEWYDPRRGAFEVLADVPWQEMLGGSAVTLTDGKVLLVWRGGYQTFDPATRAFGPPTLPALPAVLLSDAQIVPLRDGKVLIAGGCSMVEQLRTPCSAADVAQIYDPAADDFTQAPPLAVPRAGGIAVLDGDGAVLVAGGWGEDANPATQVERWTPEGSTVLLGAAGAGAPLPAGGLLVGFAPAGATAAAAARVVPPLGGEGQAATGAVARAGATLTALEDGAVLIVGGTGGAGAEAELFAPHTPTFAALDVAAADLGGARSEHGAALLADGTVLVVGGRDLAGQRRGDAWIYRHDLTGPWATVPIQLFSDGGAPLVVPADPAHARREDATTEHPDRLVLDAGAPAAGPLAAWAVLAGPRYQDVGLIATLSTTGGGAAAALLGVQGAGDYVAVLVPPGEPVTVVPVVAGVAGAPLCTGDTPVPADGLSGDPRAPTLEVTLRDGDLAVALGPAASRTTILQCGGVTAARGAVGVGLAGAAGAELALDALEVSR